MNEPITDESELIDELADSFAARIRAGERPSVDEFASLHPEFSGQLRALLPAVALLERCAAVSPSAGNQAAGCAASSPPPEEIGDFTILREVGRGGMGVVYEAVEQSLERHVALKVLSLPSLTNPKHLERFRFEARAAARLQHRNIVPVFGVGEHGGLHYYAMQFIHGLSLHEVLVTLRAPACGDAQHAANGDASELPKSTSSDLSSLTSSASGRNRREYYRNVAHIGLQVADALAYAHSEGVLHRDIKPSNLLLDAKGQVWVTDFGLARVEGNEGLTETGDFVGTLRYMAPERLEGVLDRRGDVYGLGATLYELLTFEVFFETNSQAQLVERILHKSPLPPSRLQRTIPRDLETIVLKAIAKEPVERYRTADEMAEDLRRFLADRPILARRPSAREELVRWCRRNRLVASLAGAVATLLVTALIILAWSNYRIRSEIAAKDAAFASARNSVHQLLTRVASQKLNDIPMSHPLRVDLLQDAIQAYEGLISLGEQDVGVRLQLAEVLHTIAGLQRELDRNLEAETALQKSESMYASLVDLDPNPPAVREQLAVVKMDLAYTWQFDSRSPGHEGFPVEAKYRDALALFDAIERGWPDRRQPVTLCLRSLAQFANGRGDVATAKKLWQASIGKGDAYLEQDPTRLQVRNDICWACMEYYEAILKNSPERANEAEAMLEKGIAHAETMQRDAPTSNQAKDVLAALHMREALLFCNAKRFDEAVTLFRTAIAEMHALCESVPWNTDYWNSALWFHRESLRQLHLAARDEEDEFVRQTIDWLRAMNVKVSNHKVASQKASESTQFYADTLRSIGRAKDAEVLTSDVDTVQAASTLNPTNGVGE